MSGHLKDAETRPSFTPLIPLVCKYYTVTSWENKGYNVTLAQTKGFWDEKLLNHFISDG